MAQDYISSALRMFVQERAEHRCEYCKSALEFSMHSFSIEHIWPSSKGGKSIEENLALSCGGCNSYKSDITDSFDALESVTVPLFDPRKDNWDTHFQWSEDFSLIIGQTPTGKVTVNTLRMNRPGLVNLRNALFIYGKHPPQ